MQIQRKSLTFIRYLLDCFLIMLIFFCCIFITYEWSSLNESSNIFYLFTSLLFVWFITTKNTGLYDEFRSRSFSYEVIALIRNVLIQGIALIITVFGLKLTSLPRLFLVYYTSLLIVFIGTEKYLFRKYLEFIRKRGKNLNSILIVGAGVLGERFYKSVKSNPHFGYKWLGFLDDEKKTFLNGKYLGKVSDLETILGKKRVDDVIIALPNQANEKIDFVVKTCQKYTTRVRIIPDYFRFSSKKYSVSMFGKFPIITVSEERLNFIQWRILKRGFDLGFTLQLFVLLFSWLFPILFILQKVFNPGPIFYKAERWGRGGKAFLCYKFRSMIPESKNTDSDGNHIFTNKDDCRITKFGKFLRKTNLDELPQFINVLKGEMSLVGPRPHDVAENEKIKDLIDSYMWRHKVKPGVTGWAQVNGYRGGTDKIELMKTRTEYDLWYIENWEFFLDMQIIIMTVWQMFFKKNPNAY